MAKKYLDYDGLLYFWQKIKANFVTDVTYNSTSKKIQKTKAGSTSDVVTLATVATSGSYNDLSNKPTIPTGVEPSTTTPKMDGTATVGSETKFARGDHIHPSDTSRVPITRKVNGQNLSADITLNSANIPVSSTSGDVDTVYRALELLYTGKVDVVTGKGLSTNDYTTAEKEKLAGIDDFTGATSSSAGAHGLVPAPESGKTSHFLTGDGTWRLLKVYSGLDDIVDTIQTSTSGRIQFNLKAAATNHAGIMSSTDKTKLNGIAEGAEVNVQSDWSQTDSTADDYIKNKPTIPAAQVNSDWNASSGVAQILNKPTLGAAASKGVVTSISSDSTNLPTVTAVKGYVETAITGAAAFQGTAPTTFAPTNYKKGWYWVVGTAGTYAGQTCEAGDMIFAVEDYASAYSDADFDVIQTNLDITSITNAEIDIIVAS